MLTGGAGKNPERLAQYVRDINSGKRPRARHALRADYIDYLRQKLASGDDSDAEDKESQRAVSPPRRLALLRI